MPQSINGEIEKFVANEMFDDLVDSIVQGLCFEMHRSLKKGLFMVEDGTESNTDEIIDQISTDIFGQVGHKITLDCICPNCNRGLHAIRFAPHLEKCMGMGRSRRSAARRITNSGRNINVSDDKDGTMDDGDDDFEWSFEKKKKKKDKNSPRRPVQKIKSSSSSSQPNSSAKKDKEPEKEREDKFSGNGMTTLESMSSWERRGLLNSTCCVISKHTGKMCNRSHQCPTHSDEQRRQLRKKLNDRLLGEKDEKEETFVDVDSLEDSNNSNIQQSNSQGPSFSRDSSSSPPNDPHRK